MTLIVGDDLDASTAVNANARVTVDRCISNDISSDSQWRARCAQI
jgi:hypothetical protein